MYAIVRIMVVLATILPIAGACAADVPSEVVSKGKQATALVVVGDGQVTGSAFCVDPAGYFVTNVHVVREGSKSLSIVVHSGDKDQKTFSARIIRQDGEADLALLKVDAKERFRALELGGIDGLVETQSIITFGYPFGKQIVPNGRNYPAVSVNTGHVTALRMTNGALTGIQMDALLNPGNSGGPVINERGAIIGVVVSGIPGSGISNAIPVSRLRALLDRTVIAIKPDSIPIERINRPQEFVITVDTFRKPAASIDVTFTLTSEGGTPRAFAPRSMDGQTFRVVAIPVPQDTAPPLLDLTVTDKSGDLFFRAKERMVTVGSTSVPLSAIQRITPGGRAEVLLRSGRTLQGSIHGLEGVIAVVGGIDSPLNLSRVERVVVSESSPPIRSVKFDVVARQAGMEIARSSGTVNFDESHGSPAGIPNPVHGLVLFVCSSATSIVQCYDGNTGAFIKDFAQGNGIDEPYGCALGLDGNLYVSAFNGGVVHRFDGHTGQFIDHFATGNGLSGIEGIVFGPDGNLYVSNRGTDEVKRFSGRTGAFIDTFVTSKSGGLQIPWGLTFGPDRNLYVASHWTNQIKCYDGKTGAFLRDFAGANGLDRPMDLVFGPDGNLYVASRDSDEVKRFNGKTGEFMDNFVAKGSGGMQKPLSLVFGPDSNLYVGCSTSNPVKRYNGRTGAYIDDFIPGTGGASLDPTALIFKNTRR